MWLWVFICGSVLLYAALWEKKERVPGTLEKKITVHPAVILTLVVIFVLLLIGALSSSGSGSVKPTQTSSSPPVQVGR